jgi:hypothetical protein
MKITRLATVLALLAGTATVVSAQQPIEVHAVLEAWYTQMMDNNLRLNAVPAAAGYYANGPLNSAFRENTTYLRRTEIYLNGKVGDQVTWGVIFDPNTSSNSQPAATNNLLDMWMAYAIDKHLSVKIGQFKMPTNYESSILSGSKLMFFDRSMTARIWAEKRDRGVLATYSFGDPSGLATKIHVGVSNGMEDSSLTYKANDTNAQKDWNAAIHMTYGKDHTFGAWYREGETDVKDVATVAGTGWSGTGYVNAPTADQILGNKDKTTSLGAFYMYDTARWHASAEWNTGLLGRKYPTIFGAASAVKREHLDQKYASYTLSGAYKMGRHWITARYDFLNFNDGDKYYTATNPYMSNVTTGAPTGIDYSPKYSEAILGYNFLFNPAKYVDGKIKVDYIRRSKNFLAPRAGQTGEQGGDSIVMSVQIGF